MPNGLALAISLLVILLFLAYIVSIILNFFTPFFTTPNKALKKIVGKFNLKPNQKFVDLGSGDGRVVFQTYSLYKCTSVGYEISPVLSLFVKLKKFLISPFNPKIQFKDESFFKINLREYDVVYCCLPNDVLSNLEKKFSKELKKGSVVYCLRNELPKKQREKIRAGEEVVYRYTF